MMFLFKSHSIHPQLLFKSSRPSVYIRSCVMGVSGAGFAGIIGFQPYNSYALCLRPVCKLHRQEFSGAEVVGAQGEWFNQLSLDVAREY